MAQPEHTQEQNGFVGAVSGMSLADIIQVKNNNRYSGCLAIEHLGESGVIFFREGDIVHAEQGVHVGEEAFYAIMNWTDGSFRSEPNVLTTSKTITKPMGFLVLEAFRRIDESKNCQNPPQQASTNSDKGSGGAGILHARLKALPEVEKSVIISKEGAVVDDSSYESELLGAQGLFLALFSGQVGSQFGLGIPKSVTVHGSEHHLFLFDSKHHYLCISAKGSGNVKALDVDIRQALSQK